MGRQRDRFFGQRPARTPRKDGTNPPVPQRRFAALDPAAIDVRFDNDTATQFGGLGPLAHFLNAVGLRGGLAQHVKMPRGPIAFTAPELGWFLIVSKLLGASRLMHVETFRCDPMLTHCAGLDGLPSGKTLGVYLKRFTPEQQAALERYTTRTLHRLWKRHYRGQPRQAVILDYDSSTITVYGKQAGADRGRCFRKKDKPGYQPKFAFLGGLGLMLHQRLEPQSHNLATDFDEFHAEAVAKLPRKARIWAIRGDGGLYSGDRIRAFEQAGYVYAISATRTADLQAAILQIPEAAWEEGTDAAGRPFGITRITYCPKTWDGRPRTFLISRRLKADAAQGRLFAGEQYKYFAYVTNYRAPLVSQFRFCVERCSLESFIKEAKGGFDYQFLPCAEANANAAYLLHVQLAYNLAIFFKWAAAPRGVNRWTIATLRERLLCIAGNLRRRAGQWLLSLPRWWPYRTVFQQLARRPFAFAVP